MTESAWTAACMKQLRLLRKDWVVWKVNDRIAVGVPDLRIDLSGGGSLHKSWAIEVKKPPVTKGQTFKGVKITRGFELLTPKQQYYMTRLEQANVDVAVLTCWPTPQHARVTFEWPNGTELFVCSANPSEVAQHLSFRCDFQYH